MTTRPFEFIFVGDEHTGYCDWYVTQSEVPQFVKQFLTIK